MSHWSNQVLVKNKEGVKLDDAVDRITARLEKKGMEVKGTTVRTYMPHIAYMDRALAQVQIAAVFLPVFFYTVAMIVVGLFINQIIKAMTPQIGIMVSVGVGKGDIIKLFLIYTVLMALASVIIGAPLGGVTVNRGGLTIYENGEVLLTVLTGKRVYPFYYKIDKDSAEAIYTEVEAYNKERIELEKVCESNAREDLKIENFVSILRADEDAKFSAYINRLAYKVEGDSNLIDLVANASYAKADQTHFNYFSFSA